MKNQLPQDQRSTVFVFVPFCLTCQAFQARGIVRYGFESVIRPILDELIRCNVNIVQMPCPESQLGGLTVGLQRLPRGIQQYDTPEFRDICIKSAVAVADQIVAIQSVGYTVACILGIEYSPSCSVRNQYLGKRGTVRQPGIFIQELQKLLETRRIELPFIGINRRGVEASRRRISSLIHNMSS